MTNHSVTSQSVTAQSVPHELVLVVQREHLFPDGSWQGIARSDVAFYESIIREHQEFLPRTRMETDPRYKQIIPYLVFSHQGSYFVMQRRTQASEQRLQGRLSLGIGGHINPEDLAGASIIDWSRREFMEEVAYEGTFSVEPFGIINDDSNEVGKVHLGFVFLLHGDSARIAPKEEFKDGFLMTLEECYAQYERMEPWSQMIIDALRS